jgi:hypothetical protein
MPAKHFRVRTAWASFETPGREEWNGF